MSEAERDRRTMFEQALDAMPDGVLITDADRKVVYHNAAFTRHWHIPDDILASKIERRLIDHVLAQLVDPAGFVAEVDRIHPTSESSQGEIAFKDGRVLSRRSVPFSTNGNFAARLWIFTDVTEARHASLDVLCDIPNRRAFSLHFPAFAEDPHDSGLKAIGLIDVDHFKAYNDRHGHAEGDAVLRRIGALLRDHSSEGRTQAFRIGGEEFCLTHRCHNRTEASEFFDTIRTDVIALDLRHDANPRHARVTVSIGFDTFRGPVDAASLFDRVDAALYRAKHRGRNRIEGVEAAGRGGKAGPHRTSKPGARFTKLDAARTA